MCTLKTEQIGKVSLAHRLFGWCKKVADLLLAGLEWAKKAGPKKVTKFVFMYGLYIFLVWSFDYLWMPWLAIKFRYYTFFPLYVSLFVVCILCLFLYDSFKEDIFFKDKIQGWLAEEGKYRITQALKRVVNSNQRTIFAAISAWWSPLHGYIYFREGDKNHLKEVIRLFGEGSFYCAFFWGVIVFILSALWDLGKLLYSTYICG